MIAIIIPVRNNLEYTKKCLGSIHEHTRIPYHLIVIDNASTDGTPKFLEKWSKKIGKMTTIRNPKPQDYTKSINQGLREAYDYERHKLFQILNNDMVMLEGWLEPLVEAAKDSEIGLLSPKELHMDGKISCYGVFLSRGLFGYCPFSEVLDEPRFTATIPSGVAQGSMMIKREVIEKIGYYDERYDWYCSDLDYSFSALDAEFKIVCVGKSKIYHYGSATVKKYVDYASSRNRNIALFVEKWRAKLPRMLEIEDELCRQATQMVLSTIQQEDKGDGSNLFDRR